MNPLPVRTTVVLALGVLAGCTALPAQDSVPTWSNLPATAAVSASSESRHQWREEAQELRAFADRHDVEAEVLLQHPSPADARLIRQRRALARQLRVAAVQIEQRAEQMQLGLTGESD